jgi:hypothetical protein
VGLSGAQKADGIGYSIFTIKRTSYTGHFPFVPCDAERYKLKEEEKLKRGFCRCLFCGLS